MKTKLEQERPIDAVCMMSGAISQGRFILDDVRTFNQRLAKLEGARVLLRVDRVEDARTLESNRAYRGAVGEMERSLKAAGVLEMEFNGKRRIVTTDTLHEFFKELFNNGESTTTLDDKDFAVYREHCMAYAATEWKVEFQPRAPLVL